MFVSQKFVSTNKVSAKHGWILTYFQWRNSEWKKTEACLSEDLFSALPEAAEFLDGFIEHNLVPCRFNGGNGQANCDFAKVRMLKTHLLGGFFT